MEEIERVEILQTGALVIVLASGGKPSYQYVYREAAEVSWDNGLKAFVSPSPRSWSHSDWFHHIIKVASYMDIELCLVSNTQWVNIPEEVKELCLVAKNT